MTAAALVAALVAAPVALAAPASADVTGTTSTQDVVLYQQCQQHPIDYDLKVAGLTLPWRVSIRVIRADGTQSEGTVLNSAQDPALRGTTFEQFCGSEPAGTWTVLTTVRYAPIDLSLDNVVSEETFTVRAPATRTGLTTRHLGPRSTRLVARVRVETPNGFANAQGVDMQLQRKVGSAWKPVKRVRLTPVRGRASTVVTGRGTYRVVTPATNNLAGSVSRAVRVR